MTRADDFNLNRPDAIGQIKGDAQAVPQVKSAAVQTPANRAERQNFLSIFKGNYCTTHPAVCQDSDPNNPLNPDYCNLHPEDSNCDDPDDPINPAYCNYHPAACGEVPLPPMAMDNLRTQAKGTLASSIKTDYCAKHPDACSDPNNPMNPNYCNYHPDEPGCSDPDDPGNPNYCNYHPAACGEVPPMMPVRTTR